MSENNFKMKTELLSPAGSYEVFKAVINAGADAVYLAGNMYGARAYAGNLSDEELLKAVEYSKIHGIKLYLAVNTLLKNSEIRNLYGYLLPLYEAGLDAVIVQDYGVMKIVHECFPDMDIHASTQMTVTVPEYADFLKKYGVKRIVPARELSLNEIKAIREQSGLEIETFIHGALCYSYSGMCFMSSFIGGRSGNRGRCAQPCRLPYRQNAVKGNLFSLKDLCTVDFLPDIIEAGVSSLKIEGRMKSAEYAAGVTSIYRKYLDLYYEKGKNGYNVDKKDKDRLLLLFDRGGLTDGYYMRHNGRKMLADSVKSDKSRQEKKAYENYLHKKYVEEDNKIKINCTVSVTENNPIEMTLCKDDITVKAFGEIPEKALNRAVTEEDIVKQAHKFGNTPYIAKKVEVNLDEGLFVQLKSINELRRKALDGLNRELNGKYRRNDAKPYLKKEYVNGNTFKGISVRVMTAEQGKAALECGIKRLICETELMSAAEIKELLNMCRMKDVLFFTAFPKISRMGYGFFTDNADTLIDGTDGVMIRNIAQKKILDDIGYKGFTVSDYTCFNFNDVAAECINGYGIDGSTYPVELNGKELKKLVLKDPELLVYGRLPLMFSANCIDKSVHGCHAPHSGFTSINDRMNVEFSVLACCRYCYNIIYNNVPLYIIDKYEAIKEISPSYTGLSFTVEDAGTVKSLILETEDAVYNGIIPTPPESGFTRGHFTRGVE